MYVKGLAFVIVLICCDWSVGAPRPCPQFLPVAVRTDSPRTPVHLKTSVKVKNDEDNFISKDSDRLLSDLYPTDLLLPDVKRNPILHVPENKPNVPEVEEKIKEPKLIQISEIPKDNSEVTQKPSTQRVKKRRRLRPKEPRKIILSQNSNWALKTINDKPAAEVLVTDKASVARDLKDATESALIAVKKLDEVKY